MTRERKQEAALSRDLGSGNRADRSPGIEPKLHTNNPIGRANGEIKCRTEVVGNFANADTITRLVAAILLKQNDELAVQRARYMTLVLALP